MEYGIHVAVCEWLIEGIRLGMPMNVQVRVSMTLLHMCEGFSYLNEEADDHDVIR